jgi:tetratricopeptide (TPR) repeat protein
MKTKLTFLTILAMLCVIGAAGPAWAQTARVSGKVTDNDQPQPGVQVLYKSVNNGRSFKMKTDKNGDFFSIGIPIDVYNVTVVDSSGKTIFTHDKLSVGSANGEDNNIFNIDITKGSSAITPGGASSGSAVSGGTQKFAGDDAMGGQSTKTGTTSEGGSKVSKEEVERIKAANVKAANINELIKQYNTAATAKDWQAAIPPLQAMVAASPTHWDYMKTLGDMQLNAGDYDSAVQSYEKAIQVAQGYASGATPPDSKEPITEPAKAKAGIGQMYTAEGNAYLKLKKTPEAIAAFTKGADMDPNPGIAYFNLCATEYNTGDMKGAAATCEKAIQADPTRADAYFIKGSAMYGDGKMDASNKYTVPPGTVEALKKYLEIAPTGAHANDVKAMLDALGQTIETTYKDKSGKKK